MLSLSKHPGFAEARFAEALSGVEGEAEGSTQYRADRSTLRDQDSSGAVWDTLRLTPSGSAAALLSGRVHALVREPSQADPGDRLR